MIIGLTGKNAAGKGEAANCLKLKGFVYYSLSDVIRDEATNRGMDHSRETLIKLGNELRQKFKPNYLAQQINRKIKDELSRNKNLDFVIDSIRSPFEVEELRKNKNFILVGIEAPAELRFERLLKRNRIGDTKTLEEFKSQEERENLKSDTNQQLDKTLGMADKVIVNDGTLEELKEKIYGLLIGLNKKFNM